MNRFVEVDNGKRELVIVSNTYGQFYQHYVHSKGWFTCLSRWCICPFCKSAEGSKYRCKKKYYFDVIELDVNNSMTSKILVLSRTRGETLIELLTRVTPELSGKPFSLEKQGENMEFKLVDREIDMRLYSDILLHDWDVVCAPVKKEKAEYIIQSDNHLYDL